MHTKLRVIYSFLFIVLIFRLLHVQGSTSLIFCSLCFWQCCCYILFVIFILALCFLAALLFRTLISMAIWSLGQNCGQLRTTSYGLKRGTVRQIVRFISQSSLNISSIQIWKYFHSMVLGNVGNGYFKRKGVRVFSQNLCLGCLSGSFCVSSLH